MFTCSLIYYSLKESRTVTYYSDRFKRDSSPRERFFLEKAEKVSSLPGEAVVGPWVCSSILPRVPVWIMDEKMALSRLWCCTHHSADGISSWISLLWEINIQVCGNEAQRGSFLKRHSSADTAVLAESLAVSKSPNGKLDGSSSLFSNDDSNRSKTPDISSEISCHTLCEWPSLP